MKTVLLIGAAMLLGASPAMAEDWRMLRFNGTGDKEVAVYYDIAAVKKPSATTREMTVANVYAKQQKFSDGDPYWMIRTSYALDCGTMKATAILTEAVDGTRVAVSSTNPGQPVSFGTGSPYSRAAKAVCGGDYSDTNVRTEGTPQQDAPLRFADRARLQASLISTNWARITVGGPAGAQLAIFVDRNSISTDARGRKLAATMVIEEAPNGADDSKRFHYSTRIDCAANTRSNTYAQVYTPAGDWRGSVFPAGDASVMTPGKLVGAYARVCTDSWGETRAYPMLPQAILGTAFAP